MEPALKSYLYTHRLKAGLSQGEVAFLLGFKSGSVVSRIERQRRPPVLMVALGCQVLFGSPQAELFPGLYTETEDAVMRRAYELHERLQGKAAKRTKAKLDFLEDVLARAIARHNKQTS